MATTRGRAARGVPLKSPSTAFEAALGWGAIPHLATADEVTEIIRQCEALLNLPPQHRFARDDAHSGTRHLERLDERIDLVAEVVGRSVLTDAVVSAQTDSTSGSLTLDQVAYRSPRPGFGSQALHIDSTPDHAADYVTVIVPLVDFTATNGATRIVPGSHRRPDLWRTAATHHAHRDELSLLGAAGTAFVLAGGLLHSGTRNTSDAERPALQLIWRR